jgi:prepilin-type N-terminal cleavage/methylation domain-containing protein
MTQSEQGFTLIELLVTIILSSLFSMLLLFFFVSYWRYGYLLQADLDTLTTRLNAGDILREQIGTSAGLITQNGLPDTHTNVPDPANATNQYWIPIHAIPGTANAPASGAVTPLIYFRRYAFNASGNYIYNGTQAYEDEYVLYLDGATKSLMQRSISNANAPGDRLITSCPPSIATASCPADKTIATDIASVATRYFSRTGNLLDWTSVYDPSINSYAGPDFPAVEVVEFTLNLAKKPTFQKTTATSNSTIIRVALRND